MIGTEKKRTFVENPDKTWDGDGGMATVSIRPDKVVRACLIILTILSSLSAIYFAKSVLLPLTLAIIIATPLVPAVEALAKRGVPRAISGLIGLGVLAAVGLVLVLPIASQIRELELHKPEVVQGHYKTFRTRFAPVLSFLERAKSSAETLEDGVEEVPEPPQKAGVISAPAEGESGDEAEDESPLGEAETPVVVVKEQPPLLYNFGSPTVLASSLLIILVTVYFVLASGDQLTDGIVGAANTTAVRERLSRVVEGVRTGLSTYLATITAVNFGLGVCVGLAMWLMGVPGAMLIGFMAFIFNFVPMVGALIGVGISFLVAVMTFPNSEAMWWFIVPGVYFTLTTIEGNFVTPSLIGKSMEMNPLMVFLSIVLWGWLWGLGGIIVAVPILAATKEVLENFDSTRRAAGVIG